MKVTVEGGHCIGVVGAYGVRVFNVDSISEIHKIIEDEQKKLVNTSSVFDWSAVEKSNYFAFDREFITFRERSSTYYFEYSIKKIEGDTIVNYPGNEAVKRGLEIAAVGNLGVLLVGQFENKAITLEYANSVHNNYAVLDYEGTCPCGYYMDFILPCECEIEAVFKHWEKIKTNINKYHLIIEVTRVDAHKVLNPQDDWSDSIRVKERVQKAKGIEVNKVLGEDSLSLLESAINKLYLFPAQVENIRITACCIAALAGREIIRIEDIAEAIQYQAALKRFCGGQR